jgi:hypothetical protein
MADQTVSVEGDSGSKQNVAFKLWNVLRYELRDQGDTAATINQQLDLYATCLEAASYGRKTKLGA